MSRARTGSVLAALGFSPAVDRLYRQLRSQSGRDLARVAASVLRTPDELLDELGPLLEAGIVRVVAGRLEVEPPNEAVRLVVRAEEDRAERTRRRLHAVGQALGLLAGEAEADGPSPPGTTRPFEGEVVTGGDVRSLVRSLVLDARGDLLWLRPDQWRGPRESAMAALVGEALRRGDRRSRAVYPVRALHDARDALEARAAAGEELRVMPELPTRLLVVGDSHVVLPDPLGYADLPLAVVRQRGVVEAMTRWFESIWERAAVPDLGDPLAATRAPRPDLRRFLLQQLAAGAHDEQVARQLGTSLRTVRRRVAALMTELGADSRFQAGVEAARRGWI
jgi:DNA-binding CsgD family transcriptional regulator